jgi:hypothetical protein
MAGKGLHHAQDPVVVNSLLPQAFDHQAPHAFVPVCIFHTLKLIIIFADNGNTWRGRSGLPSVTQK